MGPLYDHAHPARPDSVHYCCRYLLRYSLLVLWGCSLLFIVINGGRGECSWLFIVVLKTSVKDINKFSLGHRKYTNAWNGVHEPGIYE